MSFFNHVSGGGISAVHPPGNEPRDPMTGRRLVDLTAGQLEIVYERNPELRKLGIELCDRRKHPEPEIRGMWNGSPIVDISKQARESALLREPSPTRHAPTTPSVRSSDRTVAVAFHEGYHCAAALHNGVRVLKATIVADSESDGLTTMLLDRKDCPTIHAYVSIAAEESDIGSGYPMPPESYASDRDVGGSLEWREGIRAKVREELHLFSGGAIEIARKLIAKPTLSEFEIKAAYIRGQRRAEQKSATAGKRGGRVTRTFNLSDPKDLADFNRHMGREPDAAPIGYTSGHIVDGSYKQ